MKTITVTDRALTVSSGQVQLSAEQARARMHALSVVKADAKKGGVFNIEKPIQFKVGESFGFSGELTKTGMAVDREAEEIARLEAAERVEREIRAKLKEEFASALEAGIAAATADMKQALEDAGKRIGELEVELSKRPAAAQTSA